jgi:hypothetical protein
MQGNCAKPPSEEMKASSSLDLPPGQCVVFVQVAPDSFFLRLERRMWIDNLYIIETTAPSQEGQKAGPIIQVTPSGRIWVTQSTIQGSQVYNGIELNQIGIATEGSTYVSGALHTSFHPALAASLRTLCTPCCLNVPLPLELATGAHKLTCSS